MSIIERAAALLGPITPTQRKMRPAFTEEETHQPNSAEIAVDNSLLERPSPSYAAHVPMPKPEDRRPAEGQRMSRPLHIDIEKLREQSVITPDGERTSNAESFRRIKRRILMDPTDSKSEKPSNLVMVTSALPGEGKSFCTINLAISIAMEMDKTVLLVDADVAKPSITSMLGVRRDEERGLMDVLLDRDIDLAEVLYKTDIGTLSILPAGARYARATEMLASDRMGTLLAELAERYQDRIILFDSPPLLFASEASALAQRMGQIVLVVEAGRTTERALKDALARVESCNVAGVVLNKGSASGGSWYGSYGYGYGYGYDYGS
jgi:protein-tyrosine kinase